MDTKLKNNKESVTWMGRICVILMLIAAACAMYAGYGPLGNAHKEAMQEVENEAKDDSGAFMEQVFYELIARDTLERHSVINHELREYISCDFFSNYLVYGASDLGDNMKSTGISYGVYDKNGDLIRGDLDASLEEVKEMQLSEDEVRILISYGKNGAVTVEDPMGILPDLEENGTALYQQTMKEEIDAAIAEEWDNVSDEDEAEVEYQLPVNETYVFVSDYPLRTDYVYNRMFGFDGERELLSEEGYYLVPVLFAAVVMILSLILFFIPPLRLKNGITRYVPLGFGLCALGFGVLFLVYSGDIFLGVYNGELKEALQFSMFSPQTATYLEAALLIGYWLCAAILFYLAVLSVLQVFHYGIRRYVRRHTLCGLCYGAWIVCWRKCKGKGKAAGKKIYRAISIFLEPDLRKTEHKVAVRNAVICFFVQTAIVFLTIVVSEYRWSDEVALGVGILLELLVCCMTIYLVVKYLTRVRKEYEVMEAMVNEMADGNLDVDRTEDAGIFEPLCERLSQIQDAFSSAVREETKSQQMKTELITNVSHDLKTPLTAIITYIDLLKDETLEKEKQREYLAILDRKSQRLKHLIEDLFEVSKANSQNVTLHIEKIDLAQVLSGVMVEMEDEIMHSGIDFRRSVPENPVFVKADGEKTFRVLSNLIVNITKYAMPGSRAYLSMEQQNGYAVVTMKNISAQELNIAPEYLTERFVRGDESRNSEGSGLGLAIARSFTELQKGIFSIEIDGDLFKVIVELPLA